MKKPPSHSGKKLPKRAPVSAPVPKKAGARRSWRSTQSRIAFFLNALRDKRYPTLKLMFEKYGVTKRTVHRDIEDLQREGYPIALHPVRKGYYLTEGVTSKLTPQVKESDFFLLAVAMLMMQLCQGTNFPPSLRRALAKISDGLQEELDLTFESMSSFLSFRSSRTHVPMDPLIFGTLLGAAREGEEVEILYHALSAAEAKWSFIDPRHITWLDGLWYTLAEIAGKPNLRTYSLARIKEIRRTWRKFTPTTGPFSIEAYFKHSFGIYHSDKPVHVHVRFSARAARMALERLHHPSQRVETQPDGKIDVHLDVGITPDLEEWVLSAAEECEVIGPPELREKAIQRLRGALSLYGFQVGFAGPAAL